MQPGELLPPRLAVAFLWAAGPGTGISVTCKKEPGGHEGVRLPAKSFNSSLCHLLTDLGKPPCGRDLERSD